MHSQQLTKSYCETYLEQYWPEFPSGAVEWADNAVLMLAYQEAALAVLGHYNGVPVRMLDVSTGPALAPLLAMLPAVSEVQLSDFEESNRDFLISSPIDYWRNYVPMLVKFFSRPEEKSKEILSRLHSLRKEHAPVQVDLTLNDPFLSSIQPMEYGILSMQFVADSMTSDIREYEACLKKVCAMVRNGGALIMSAVVDSTDWKLGNGTKPSPNVSEGQILSFLNENGLCQINLSRSMRFPGLSYSGGWIVVAAVRD